MPLTLNHDDQLAHRDEANTYTVTNNRFQTATGENSVYIETGDTSTAALRLVNSARHVRLGLQNTDDFVIRQVLPTASNQVILTTDGYWLTPYQPAFNAYLIQTPTANGYSTGGVYHASATGIGINPTNILILKHTIVNRGNHYSTSTGLFTAPVAGVYRFHHAHLPDSTQGGSVDNWAEFYINGGSTDAPEMYVQTSQLSQHGAQLSGSAVFQLQAGDTVGVYMYGGMHQRYATFNGYLIG